MTGTLLQTKGEELYRYKGILSVAGFDQKFVFQGVHMLFDGEFLPNGTWGKDEPRISKFVFIGKELDKMEPSLEEQFRACIAKPLRFKVGERVLAKVKGGFREGKILKHWDNGIFFFF
jgi:G3E family GTPase